MAGEERRRGSGVDNPLAVDDMVELLESTVCSPSVLPAALLSRIEAILLQGTGATRVDAFLVNRWFNKLFHFSPAGGENVKEKYRKRRGGERGGGRPEGAVEQTFNTRTVCEIGEGVAGKAASTGRILVVRDCSRQPLCIQDRGSLVCLPVMDRRSNRSSVAVGRGHSNAEDDEDETVILENVDERVGAAALAGEVAAASGDGQQTGGDDASSGDGAVLAVLQVYCAESELAPAAMHYLRSFGRVLVPLLRGALAQREQQVQRCTAEALYSLSQIVPREVGLLAMVEEVVQAAEHLTGSERVCLFFVDDVTNELWVAKAVDFDDAKIKVGQGLCGHAAATGEAVNVINSYEDSRFDSSWDKQTGFVTKSVLCVPIPPPDPESFSSGRAGRRGLSSNSRSGAVHNSGCHQRRETPDIPFSLKPQSSSDSIGRNGGQESGGGAGGPSGSGGPKDPRQQPDKHPRPMAVLEVMNKRGGGVFDEPEETALLRLCGEVECLLRRKAAEVTLMKSGMALHSSFRNGQIGDTASSNCARVESTIMRLYSESSPADVVFADRARGGFVASPGGGGDRGHGGNGGGRRGGVGVSGESGGRSSPREGEEKNQRPRKGGTNGLAAPGASCVSGRSAGGNLGVVSDWEEQSSPRLDVGSWEERVSSSAVDRAGATLRSGIRPPDAIVEEESELVDWSLNIFERTAEQQLSFVERFFRSMGVTERFQISDKKLHSFALGVEKRYHPNPFHNLTHAVSVTHAAFAIVKSTKVNSLLRPLDKLGLLTAAFCHDIDHPGNNNDYEVNSLSPLALQHGDSSVLERHHIFVTFQVLLQEGGANNILSELTRSEFREVRKIMVQAILATDMTQHMQHCAEVSRFAQKAKGLRGHGGGVSSGCSGRSGQEGGREGGGAGGGGGGGEDSALAVGSSSERSFGREGDRHHGGASETMRASTAGSAGKHATKRTKLDDKMSAPPPAPPPPSLRVYDEDRGHGRERTRAEERQYDAEHLFSIDRAEDRSFLTRTILHCADLSGQVLDTRLALEWGQRILEEFRIQADLEAKAGLSPTTLASSDQETTMKGQHFFLARIVKPLWEPFVTIFPELDPLLANLNRNCEYYYHEAFKCERQRLRSDKQGGEVDVDGRGGDGNGSEGGTL